MKYTDFLLPLMTGFSGAFTAWFFVRKKQAAETDTVELENVNKAIGIWRQLAEDVSREMDGLRSKQQQLLEENKVLNEKVDELICQNAKLTKEIRTLEGKVQTLTIENKKLIAQINKRK